MCSNKWEKQFVTYISYDSHKSNSDKNIIKNNVIILKILHVYNVVYFIILVSINKLLNVCAIEVEVHLILFSLRY